MSFKTRHKNDASACGVCDGHAAMPHGQGIRCYGYTTTEAIWCTQIHSARYAENAGVYAHDINGECHCGVTHGEPAIVPPPPMKRLPRPTRAARPQATLGDPVEEYVYRDLSDVPLYRVLRYDPKTFRQQRAIASGPGQVEWVPGMEGVKRVLFNLRGVEWARTAGHPIWFFEGEKDVCCALQLFCDLELNDTATCNAGGSSGWDDGLAYDVRDALIINIVQDRDEPGIKWAARVRDAVLGRAPEAEITIWQSKVDKPGADFFDHEQSGYGLDDLELVWRSDPPASPLARRQRVAIAAGVAVVEQLTASELSDNEARALSWPAGLPSLKFSGLTILSGQTGSAKSVVAMASSIDAAADGCRVLYFSAELGIAHLRDRLRAYLGLAYDAPVEVPNWSLYCVGMNTSFEVVQQAILDQCDGTPLLVVFDSVNTMVANEETPTEGDVFQLGAVAKRVMWARNAVTRSGGLLGVLMVSEASKTGEMKGRFSYRADMAVSLEKDSSDYQKIEVTIVKNWAGKSGPVGHYQLDTQRMRLVLP